MERFETYEIFEKVGTPDDSACPVRKYDSDFSPSGIIDELRSGWVPKSLRKCIGCEKCAEKIDASFAENVGRISLESEMNQGFIPRAFSGAHWAIVDVQIKSETTQNRMSWVTPDLKISQTGEIAFFVGCVPYYEILLNGGGGNAVIDEIRSSIRLLNAVGISPVILSDEPCCGIERIMSGDKAGFNKLGNKLIEQLKERGVKTVITSCDDCRFALGEIYPDIFTDWDFDVIRLVDYLERYPGKVAFAKLESSAAIQKPDKFSDSGKLNSVEKILSEIEGLEISECDDSLPSTFGSWEQVNSITNKLILDVLESAQNTGANTFLVPSVRNLARFLETRRTGAWQTTSITLRGLYSFLDERHTVIEDFTG